MTAKTTKTDKRLRLAIVYWGDAHSGSYWSDRSEVDKNHAPEMVHTVGWVMKRDRRGITVASRKAGDSGDIGLRSFIPRGMIKSVSYIPKGDLVKHVAS